MSTVPATEELTVTLPKEVADLVRSQVAAGKYATPGEYISRAVCNDFAYEIAPPIDEGELEEWLRTEIPRRCAEADAHPEEMLTVADMRRAIEEEIEAIRNER
jgi:Arc/MetJ-type ribon-helix-helix transcriptional regulator